MSHSSPYFYLIQAGNSETFYLDQSDVRDSADCLLVGHFSFLEPEKVLEPGIQVLATLTLYSLPFRVSAKLEDKPMVSFDSLLPHDFSLKQA